MSERRMFTKKITESDAFLDMPATTQMLYFHLSMNADDDGFVNNPRKIQRMCGASNSDYDTLIIKRFLIEFENGVIVIKHWQMHNYIQKDGYKPNDYSEEKNMLIIKDNKSYTLDPKKVDTKRIQNVYKKNGEYIEETHEIVDYLNSVCGTKYKPTSAVTKRYIHARIKDGFSVDDFKEVIDKKSSEWLGTEMEKYLRPQTLFCTKFESYLNQPNKKKSETEGWAAS